MQERKCFMCGRNGNGDPLERHHIFGASNRDKSERLGLVVDLCGNECHRLGRLAAHRNKDTMLFLHQYGQIKAMKEQNWTVADFRREFGHNYLDIDEEDFCV